MPVFTEEQIQSNPILKLAADLRRRTYGMCDVGVGAWGYGVNTLSLTKVGAVIRMDPDPNIEEPLPPEVKEYTITIQPTCADRKSVRCGKKIDAEEFQRLCTDQDIITRLVANAIREMSAVSVTASVQEDVDAYEAIRVAELEQDDRFTQEEAERLEELRWYETKTPEEIVDFQVCEKRLCMPMERFREAAEAVFQHPITAETLDDCRTELLVELREMTTAAAQQPLPQITGPVML